MSNIFSSYLHSGRQKIKIADGTFFSIAGQGTVKISNTITLQSTLHVPNLDYNLLSIGKLVKDLNYSVKFIPSGCCFQDRSGKMIGAGKMRDGLYYLDTD